MSTTIVSPRSTAHPRATTTAAPAPAAVPASVVATRSSSATPRTSSAAGRPPAGTTRPSPPRSGVAPRSEPPAALQRAAGVSRVRTLSLGGPSRYARAEDLSPSGRPVGTTSTDPVPLPDPTALCCAVVRAAVEVLRGERSLTQLSRWVSPEIYDALARRAQLSQAAPDPRKVTRPVGIRRARLVRIGDTAAEATVILDDVDRVRAAAVRLEARRGAWRVVNLEIG